jgi:hypothetical protein
MRQEFDFVYMDVDVLIKAPRLQKNPNLPFPPFGYKTPRDGGSSDHVTSMIKPQHAIKSHDRWMD